MAGERFIVGVDFAVVANRLIVGHGILLYFGGGGRGAGTGGGGAHGQGCQEYCHDPTKKEKQNVLFRFSPKSPSIQQRP